MATPVITQTEFFAIVNGMMHQKFSQVADRQVVANRAVRYVIGDMDLRSHKRRSVLSPNMFVGVFDYAAPATLKGNKIIDIRRQVNRPSYERWLLVDEADFDRRKNISNYRIAIRDEEFSKLLRIDGLPTTKNATIHNCNSVAGNGTWAAVAGTDASNVTLDSDNYIVGGGSINFDTAAGAATAAIELTGATQVDLTDHDEKGSIFLWVFIPDYSDAGADVVTNFILRWGNDSAAYWHRTVTVNNEGDTFHDGWNLLRFDWNGATEVGTVDPAKIDYLRLTITKPAGFDADTDWRIDDIVSRVGEIYDVIYYTKFGWQTTALVYIEEATTTTDLIIADTDEIEMIAFKAAEFASQELKEKDEIGYFKGEYESSKKKYLSSNPSEALKVQRNYGRVKIRKY